MNHQKELLRSLWVRRILSGSEQSGQTLPFRFPTGREVAPLVDEQDRPDGSLAS